MPLLCSHFWENIRTFDPFQSGELAGRGDIGSGITGTPVSHCISLLLVYLSPSLPAFLCKFVYVGKLRFFCLSRIVCLPESVYLSVVFIFLFFVFSCPIPCFSLFIFPLVSVFCVFSVISLFPVGLPGFDLGLCSCRLWFMDCPCFTDYLVLILFLDFVFLSARSQ